MSTPAEKVRPLVGIFADDLTGALDAAAPFAARGFRTLVSPTHHLPKGAGGAEVVSVNLGTRHRDPGEIAARTSAAVGALVELGSKVLLNKIDSALRGNPGVELFAAMTLLSADHSVLCPAYPQNHRTVEDGMLLVDGVPVAGTEIGQDQFSPLSSSSVKEILHASLTRAGLRGQVEVRDGRSGDSRLNDRPVIVLPDARTGKDLRIFARRVADARPPALIAGSAGTSAALAEALGGDGAGTTVRPGQTVNSVLIVTASQRTIVDEQLSVLGDRIELALAEIPAREAIDGISRISVARLASVARDWDVTVVKLGKLDGNKYEPSKLRAMAGTIVNSVGRAVREITDAAQPDAIVVIGGDTAGGVLGACGVTSIILRGELQPGTVSGTPADGSIDGVLLVTRAGGFGDKNALFELVSLLKYGLKSGLKFDEGPQASKPVRRNRSS